MDAGRASTATALSSILSNVTRHDESVDSMQGYGVTSQAGGVQDPWTMQGDFGVGSSSSSWRQNGDESFEDADDSMNGTHAQSSDESERLSSLSGFRQQSYHHEAAPPARHSGIRRAHAPMHLAISPLSPIDPHMAQQQFQPHIGPLSAGSMPSLSPMSLNDPGLSSSTPASTTRRSSAPNLAPLSAGSHIGSTGSSSSPVTTMSTPVMVEVPEEDEEQVDHRQGGDDGLAASHSLGLEEQSESVGGPGINIEELLDAGSFLPPGAFDLSATPSDSAQAPPLPPLMPSVKDDESNPSNIAWEGPPPTPSSSTGMEDRPQKRRREHEQGPSSSQQQQQQQPRSGGTVSEYEAAKRAAIIANTKTGFGGGAFVYKVYQILLDPRVQNLISFTQSGKSFVVYDVGLFEKDILPIHFKHWHFTSFVRQLNMYGFQKDNKLKRGQANTSDGQTWEFSHPLFQCGRPELLERIKRRAPDSEKSKLSGATAGVSMSSSSRQPERQPSMPSLARSTSLTDVRLGSGGGSLSRGVDSRRRANSRAGSIRTAGFPRMSSSALPSPVQLPPTPASASASLFPSPSSTNSAGMMRSPTFPLSASAADERRSFPSGDMVMMSPGQAIERSLFTQPPRPTASTSPGPPSMVRIAPTESAMLRRQVAELQANLRNMRHTLDRVSREIEGGHQREAILANHLDSLLAYCGSIPEAQSFALPEDAVHILMGVLNRQKAPYAQTSPMTMSESPLAGTAPSESAGSSRRHSAATHTGAHFTDGHYLDENVLTGLGIADQHQLSSSSSLQPAFDEHSFSTPSYFTDEAARLRSGSQGQSARLEPRAHRRPSEDISTSSIYASMTAPPSR